MKINLFNSPRLKALVVGLLLFPLSSLAEDIDLFVGTPPATADIPNVLIVLDNTANWNTAFTNEMAALVSVVNSLPENRFKLGLMLFTETGGGNSGSDGAYVRAAIRPLTAANKLNYQTLVSSFDKNADKSNGGKIGQTMREAYLYFSGGTPFAGNNKIKSDYTGNISGTAASNAIYALPNNALNSIAGNTYRSPVTSGCAKNFIIYISNGAAQDNASDTSNAKTALAALNGNTTQIALSPSGSQTNVADEWSRFMKASAYGIVTYAIDVNKVSNGQGPGWTALLKSASVGVGGGKYFDVASSGTEIVDALNLIFTEIQSVNSVFASVSLPVSVNTQGTYLNQVYVGMFRPDENSLPRWAGNLKQYKLGFVGEKLNLLDADSSAAINGQTGFVAECARSFWTPSSLDNYWAYKPQGDCLAVLNSAQSNFPDGNIVEKGAQAFKLRGTSSRSMYTCAPTLAGCTALTSFSPANAVITAGLLGATSAIERDAIINWALGFDVDDENTGDGIAPSATISSAMRPSAHGDVVHSQPVAINYGTDSIPQVILFYGGNDGVLRAINGNRSTSIGAVAAGAELWSFMAPEFYPSIKRSRSNSPAVSYPGSTTPGAVGKSYGFDGSISTYVEGGVKWLYASMRRGGRAIYGFNVSVLGSPIQMWKRGCDTSGCSAGFSDMGQTWAMPKVIKAAGYGAGAAPMLAMGAGYDSCEDVDPNNCTGTAKGRKIYIMDAITGNLLTSFATERGVVADVVAVSSNGLVNYLYTADLGGNIYRISGAANSPIGSVAPSSWVITKIAALGCAVPGPAPGCANNRKFMFAPDVIVDGGTHILLLGSGDREKPLTTYTNAAGVANYFFMIKDQPANAGWLTSEQTTCGSPIICLNSLLSVAADAAAPQQALVDAKKGWALQMAATEQVVTSAITVYGVVTFSSHTPAVPTPGACSNLGTAKVYNLSYKSTASAGPRQHVVLGGGLPPSPVAGTIMLDDGTRVPFIIGSTPISALESALPDSPVINGQPKVWIFRNGAR